MHIEKKHKIYAALVGAALFAWGIDAVFFESSPTGPAIAAASATPPAGPETAKTPAASSEAAGLNMNRWLADQLQGWSTRNPGALEEVHDVFSASTSWAKRQPAPSPPAKTSDNVAQDFQRLHRLTAVVLTTRGGSALIDGHLLHIGQTVDGCRLVAVASGCADLAAPDGKTFRIVIGTEPAKGPQ